MTLDNITGKGVDIPLLGIRKAMTALLEKGEIQREDYKIFEVEFCLANRDIASNFNFNVILIKFQDPAFETSISFKLSTSQVAVSLEDSYMGCVKYPLIEYYFDT